MIKKGAQKGASGNPLFSYTCPISWAPFTIIGDGGGAVQGRSVKGLESASGLVSRVSPVQTAVRNCTRDEGGPFGFGDQELIPSHRKLLWSKAMVVSVAEKSGR